MSLEPADPRKATAPTNSARKRLRDAGRFEQYFYTRACLDLFSWVVVSAKYRDAKGVGQALDRSTLFSALDHVVHSQPTLTCRLEYTSSLPSRPPTWIRLPLIDLNKLVEFRDEDSSQLSTILESMYAGPVKYAEDVPPWKLFVLGDGTLAFAYEHTIGDGQSGMAFHLALLNALNGLSPASTAHSGVVSDLPDDASLGPSIEDAMDVSVPVTALLGEVLKPLWPPARRRAQIAWTGKDAPNNVVYGMLVRVLPYYSSEDGRRLVELSRAHKTTLTGLLHTLALVVLSRLIRANPDNAKYETITTSVPISMRRFTSTPPSAFCNHVSTLRDDYPILPADVSRTATTAENFPWDLAASLVDALRQEAPRGGASVGMLKFVDGKYAEYLRGQLGKKRSAGLELSNIGPFPVGLVEKPANGSSSSGWSLDEVLFAQANTTLGPALCLNVAGSPTGGFGVTITYSKDAVDGVLAEEFVAAFRSGIHDLLA
ncbi:alcohol acetyltransferase [Lenzites betulinus]|nr:alcohol acetyltransferase [Lenzites betulinus]